MFVEFVVKKKKKKKKIKTKKKKKKKKKITTKKTLQTYIKVQLKFSSVLQASCAPCHVRGYWL